MKVRSSASIRTRLAVAMGAAIALVVAFGVVSLYQLHAINSITREIRDVRLPQLEKVQLLKRLMSEHKLLASRWIQTTNFHHVAAIAESMQATEAAVDRAQEAYRSSADDDAERAILAEFERSWSDYIGSLRTMADLLEVGDLERTRRQFELISTLAFDRAIAVLEELAQSAKEKSQAGAARAQDVFADAFAVTVLKIVLIVAFAVAAMIWISRRVTSPVVRVSQAMQALIKGDEKVEVAADRPRNDEIGILVAAVSGYRDALVRSREFAADAGLERARLHAAMNNMSQGLCFFDGDHRLIICNDQYLSLYGLSSEDVKPGTSLQEIVRLRVAAGSGPKSSPEDYLTWRTAARVLTEASESVVELANGRMIEINHQPMPDGGWVATHEDVTEARQRETMLRLLFDSNPVPMWVVDRETLAFLAVNDAAVRHYGYTQEQFMSMSALDLRPREEWDEVRAAARALEEDRHQSLVWRHIRADGSAIEVETYTKTLTHQGRPAVLAAVIDVTERRRAERRIAHSALHDALTDLPNRTALDERFRQVLERAEETGDPFAVLCFDLDRFKQINDLYGHSTGDDVLREVARRLRAACGEAFLARIGGDEFLAIATEGVEELAALVQRLESTLETEVEARGHGFELGLSMGIAIYPTDGTDATTLVANADAALYRAKEEGRGTARYFTAAMDQQLRERRALERELAGAIGRNELRLEYQPQARAFGTIIGFEALVRWQHPTRGLVAPAEFIPIAEESGFIVELGEWVLREAAREAATWPAHLRLAVNVSAIQFRRGDLQRTVHQILMETGLAPQRLELEITEGVLIENVSRAAALLGHLKSLGVGIALDDFGTGYSSLSYLQSFPLDRIKIDRSFITGLGRREDSLALVRGVIGLAHGLRLPVLAEGVETETQRVLLAMEGCDELQGFLLGRPQPIENYAEHLARERSEAPAARRVG